MNDQTPYVRSIPRARADVADVPGRVMSMDVVAALAPVLAAVFAFGVYWWSAMAIDARGGTLHFGADASHYAVLAHEWINHRAARFHPVTVALALGWMKLLAPLTAWVAPHVLLKAFFAAIGAVGVGAATVVFSSLLPRGYALLGALLYGSSLGVWYFSGIPESKIVTATLSMLYIAAYVRFRETPSTNGVVWLSVILAIACLNEIVSCFLVVIPVVDIVLRRGIDWRSLRWLVPHALVVPIAWLFLEIAVNGWIVPESKFHENQSHFDMLLYYLAKNDYSLSSLYAFVLNWVFFNIAAPTRAATLWAQAGGYFEPSLSAYFAQPASAVLIVLLVGMAVVSLMPRYRARSLGPAGALLLPLAAYTLIRAAFFFIFNPPEPMLFSPSVTLAHWLIILVPFTASCFPAKRALLALLGVLLIVTNAGFMVGPEGWANAVRIITGV